MSRFVVKESMYEDIEAEIDGKVYAIKTPITSVILDKCTEYERLAFEGDSLANYNLLNYLFKIPLTVLKKTDIRAILDLVKFITDCMITPVKLLSEEKKKD